MKKLFFVFFFFILMGCNTVEESQMETTSNKSNNDDIVTEDSEDLPTFDPLTFLSDYESFLYHLTKIGQREQIDTFENDLTTEQIEIVKKETLYFVTEHFFNHELKEALPIYFSGMDAVGLPHNLFPQVRLDVIEKSDNEISFQTLMFSNEYSTSGGLVTFSVKGEDGKWKLNRISVEEPEFHLTNEEIALLYPNQEFTSLEDKKDHWGDEQVDVLLYRVNSDNETKYFQIYRHNGQIFELNEPIRERPKPSESSSYSEVAGSWEHNETQQDVYASRIDISNASSSGFDFVIDAHYKQNIGEMGGYAEFTSDSTALFIDENEFAQGCEASFEFLNGELTLKTTSECMGYAGLNVWFDGVYLKKQK